MDFVLFIVDLHTSYNSYKESEVRMKAYSRILLKYNLLSETDGTQKRMDGTPVH